jgi:hypothetical protein
MMIGVKDIDSRKRDRRSGEKINARFCPSSPPNCGKKPSP